MRPKVSQAWFTSQSGSCSLIEETRPATDPTSSHMQAKATKFAIKNEAANGLSNKLGTLAMARTSVVDSATAQFFINVADNAFLDHRGKTPDLFGYAVFGQVVDGMDVVDAIRQVKTGSKGGHSDVPLEPVFIKSVKTIE